MVFKYCLVAFLALTLQMTSASLVVAPGVTSCGCSSTLSGPVLPPVFPNFIRSIAPPAPVVAPPVIPAQFGPSVMYDNTVSNNLANVLQLLVVSNLLDGTLPPAPCGVYRPVVSGCGTTVLY